MDDQVDYETEFNFFSGASLGTIESIDESVRNHMAIASKLAQIDALCNDSKCVSGYYEALKIIPLIRFKNPAALFLSWLNKFQDQGRMSKLILENHQGWPQGVATVTTEALFGYKRLWDKVSKA